MNLIVNKSDFDSTNKDMLLDVMKRHVVLRVGEIYEMDRTECPQFYAARINLPSDYTTLKIIEKPG